MVPMPARRNFRHLRILAAGVFCSLAIVSLCSVNYFVSRSAAPSEQTFVINALGDSITYGSCTSGEDSIYVNQIASALGADNVNNYGLPSSPVSNTVNPALSPQENQNLSFLERYPSMSKDADLIFVFGGVNDYSLNVPIGEANDSSVHTFSGALNTLFAGLVEQYPDSRIIALTPIQRSDRTGSNDAGYNLEDYANCVTSIAGNYDQVDSIDLYHAPELNFSTEEASSAYLADGLHPNDAGQKKIAEYVLGVMAAATY